MKAFVANVGKFQRGEDLAAGNNGVQLETVAKPTISESQQQQDSSHSGQKASPKVNNQGSKQNQQQGRGNKQQPTKMSFSAATSGVKKPAGAQTKKNTTKPSPPVPKKNSPVTPAAKKPVPKKKQTVAPPKRAPPPPKSHPKKGEASHVCGCFGTVHEALSNCLYCGRISCLKEGFDFCPFCNLMVEKLDVKPPEDEYVSFSLRSRNWMLCFTYERDLHFIFLSSVTCATSHNVFFHSQSKEQGLVAQGTPITF